MLLATVVLIFRVDTACMIFCVSVSGVVFCAAVINAVFSVVVFSLGIQHGHTTQCGRNFLGIHLAVLGASVIFYEMIFHWPLCSDLADRFVDKDLREELLEEEEDRGGGCLRYPPLAGIRHCLLLFCLLASSG